MSHSGLRCWKCGETLDEVPLPLSRTAQCKSCHADLHVCRMCRFYDTSVSNSCTEPLAEKVTDKKRRNFCGYLQPDPHAFRPDDAGKAESAKRQLEALFEIESGSNMPGSMAGEVLSEEESSRHKLEELFHPDKKK